MNIDLYNISKKHLYSICLLSAIAHAIMTNKYPMLSYEQSWDNCNYSMNNEICKLTVSFCDDFSVGAIRNNACAGYLIKTSDGWLPSNIPSKAREILEVETLQYLLEVQNGIPTPLVSSIFWCDNERLYFLPLDRKVEEEDKNFISFCSKTLEEIVEYWKQYYEMTNDNIELLLSLYEIRQRDISSPIFLSEAQRMQLPCEEIDDECVISLKELNIQITQWDGSSVLTKDE